MRVWALVTVLSLVGACVPETDEVGACAEPLIYGSDDRVELLQADNTSLRSIARDASVALMSATALNLDGGAVSLRAPSVGADLGLCSGERFADQPSAAFCSGTLIDHDLVLTAGHCLKSESQCRTTRFVFDYALNEVGEVTPPSTEAIYTCANLVTRVLDSETGRDFAVVQLDRPATDRIPISILSDVRTLRRGEPVVVVGYGLGLPAKVDQGGSITDISGLATGSIVVSTDTFVGNSGSPVMDRFHRMVGVLVRGQTDFDDSCGCRRSRVASEGGEEVMTFAVALEGLCGTDWPTSLCNRAAACGDGRCTGEETAVSCPNDCAETSCGNGVCEGVEVMTCPEDCAAPVPTGPAPETWFCPVEYYGTSDGCDCGCGAPDPDCEDSAQQVLNCGADQVCDAMGLCADVAMGPPESWTCDARYYAAGDDCDCSCGAYDPDCGNVMLPVVGCAMGELCALDGTCIMPTADDLLPPETWTCSIEYFASTDGCDCECGAWDPDCEDSTQTVYGCSDGAVCVGDGICM